MRVSALFLSVLLIPGLSGFVLPSFSVWFLFFQT